MLVHSSIPYQLIPIWLVNQENLILLSIEDHDETIKNITTENGETCRVRV